MHDAETTDPRPDAAILAALYRAKLLDESAPVTFEALVGGVSSDIWKVSGNGRTFCVKRALSKLKVAADWRAPVERNRFEVAWYRTVHDVLPDAVPQVLYHDQQEMLCAMEYLDPRKYRLWKSELRDGRSEPGEAAAVGRCLARIHAATHERADIAARFPDNPIFHAIRLQPYLEATAEVHPDLAPRLYELSRRTGSISSVMIHGDVSPKNILLGPRGPVFLDAECACMGDPAFDAAFCLNHLLLKCLWNPPARNLYLGGFQAFADNYLGAADWEPVEGLEQRIASLLPGLLLARVDGKSPVEYLDDPADRDRVRRVARAGLARAPARLAEVLQAWKQELNR